MDKRDFLALLRVRLSDLPQTDIDERLNFYSEIIDDYVEEGLTEDEAVSRIGAVNAVAAQILAEASLPQADESSKKSCNPWKITVIVLTSPIWLSLLVSAVAVAVSVYVSLWAVIISLWSVFITLSACAVAGIAGGVALSFSGNITPGIAMIGAALVCGGLAIFTFYGCKAATRGTILLTKNLVTSTINRLRRKEAAQCEN